MDVQATQSGSSAPVEISWSPPSDGTNSITGYRIYYRNGQNLFVTSVTVITSVSLKVDRFEATSDKMCPFAPRLISYIVNVSMYPLLTVSSIIIPRVVIQIRCSNTFS